MLCLAEHGVSLSLSLSLLIAFKSVLACNCSTSVYICVHCYDVRVPNSLLSSCIPLAVKTPLAIEQFEVWLNEQGLLNPCEYFLHCVRLFASDRGLFR